MLKIRKGDSVKIMVGKDRGKKGTVAEVDTKGWQVLLPNLNVYKKHRRPRRQGEKGELVLVSRPLPLSNVRLVCKSCQQPTRLGFRFEGATKIRYCKKCQASI